MSADNKKLKVIIYALAVFITSLIAVTFNVSTVDCIFAVLLILVFMWIAFYDVSVHLIPNLSLVFILILRGAWILFSPKKVDMLVDSVLSCGFFITVTLVSWLTIRNIKGSIGSGDYKYIIALAFCLGVEKMVIGMAATLAIAVIAFIAGKLMKKTEEHIPVAPFLSGGAVLAIIVYMIR